MADIIGCHCFEGRGGTSDACMCVTGVRDTPNGPRFIIGKRTDAHATGSRLDAALALQARENQAAGEAGPPEGAHVRSGAQPEGPSPNVGKRADAPTSSGLDAALANQARALEAAGRAGPPPGAHVRPGAPAAKSDEAGPPPGARGKDDVEFR